ncbi:MAG: hypothetical protein WCH34_10270 [Bacteroidota bacterium]
MKINTILAILLFMNKIAFSQDTIINSNSYKIIPTSILSDKEILFKLIKQKAYDYWEYRKVYETQSNDFQIDSIDFLPTIAISNVIYSYDVLANGEYKDINDSIKISKISCTDGFWGPLPGGSPEYFIAIKSNKIDSVVNKNDLFEFLKPFDSLEKIRLYFDNYGMLKYRSNVDNFELIVYENPIRYYKNKKGHYNVFKKFYLKIYKDGSFDKKRIVEYHLKAKVPFIIP